MKNISEIVDFYKSINGQNLFSISEFTVEGLTNIKNTLEQKNQEFIILVKKKSYSSNFNTKSIQFIINDLDDIYDQIHSETIDYLIPDIEQTPLFRYTIEYNKTALETAYSTITICNGITELIHLLDRNFPKDLKIKNNFKSINHVIPYLDHQSYMRHIFYKLISPNFLHDDCYNKTKKQVEKINEFLEINNEIVFQTPIKIKTIDNTNDITDLDTLDFINEINSNQSIINEAFEFFPDEIDYAALKNKEIPNKIDISIQDLKPELDYNIKLNYPKEKEEEALKFLVDFFETLKKLRFIDDYIENEIIEIFSGKYSTKVIYWKKGNSLRYLFNQIEHVYGLITITGEKWETICHYFHKNDKEKHNPTNLASNTSFKKTDFFEELIMDFRKKLKSLEK